MTPDNSIPGRKPEKSGRPGEVKCPHCSAMIQPVRLERHIQRRHSDMLPAAPADAAVLLHRKPSPFETCPECGKTMHRRFLAEHSKQHAAGSSPKE